MSRTLNAMDSVMPSQKSESTRPQIWHRRIFVCWKSAK